MTRMRLDDITADDRTRVRHELRRETINEYRQDYERGDQIPPLDVFHVGDEHLLADGWHRLESLRELGREFVEVTIHEGTEKDAFEFSARANSKHGIRRSSADKRRAVESILNQAWAEGLTQRQIAEAADVSVGLVSKVIAERSGEEDDAEPGDDLVHGEQIATSEGGSDGGGDGGEGDEEEDDSAGSVAAIVYDTLEREVPEWLHESYHACLEIERVARLLDQVKKGVADLAATNGGGFLEKSQLEVDIKKLKYRIRSARYYTACPQCAGAGCKRCQKRGFIPFAMKGMLSGDESEEVGA